MIDAERAGLKSTHILGLAGMTDQMLPTKRRGTRRQGNAPTITDVARLAGCSSMTVSRVVNGDGNVREKTREKVRAAIEQLNYAPNRAARSLAGGEQIRIALLFDNPSASYLSELLMGALEEANRSDIHLMVQSCDIATDVGMLMRNLARGGINGFILPPPLCDDQDVLDLVAKLDAVSIAVGPGRAVGAHGSVMIDDFKAAYDMTSHIIGLGHRRIGFIIGKPEQIASVNRLDGYRAAMADAGLEVSDELIAQGSFTYRSGMAATERLLAVRPRPTAIFASNDDMAAATVAVAHRQHLDVPSDISVCGFDDTEMASTIWPELTTIRQPIRDMSAYAVKAIARVTRAKRAGDELPVEQATLPYTLVRRHSDAAPALSQRRVGDIGVSEDL